MLRDFQQNPIVLKGVGTFRVEYKGRKKSLDLFVTEGPYSNLLGMIWLPALGIRLMGINQATSAALLMQQDFEEVCKEFPEVFDGRLRMYKGPPIMLPLDPACPGPSNQKLMRN